VDCGVTGTLGLGFLNGRLAQTTFTPSDFELYLRKLSGEKGIHFWWLRARLRFIIGIFPHTRVWTGRIEDGDNFISWEDSKIIDEEDKYRSY
jgi:hypothetical protein